MVTRIRLTSIPLRRRFIICHLFSKVAVLSLCVYVLRFTEEKNQSGQGVERFNGKRSKVSRVNFLVIRDKRKIKITGCRGI